MRKIHNAVPLNGGGASLNFEVVGSTTQPVDPKENTIWVNTATEITSWEFSANEPTTAEAGAVWIQTATAAPNAFNALKKNTLMTYPIGVFMYDGMAWITAIAQIYYGGEWHGFELLLYERGNFYNQDVIPILSYGAVFKTDLINLQYQPDGNTRRGIYTQTSPPAGYSTIHIIYRTDLEGYKTDIQYGQNTLTASLPSVSVSGTGRVTYENRDNAGEAETEITINITGEYGFFICCTNYSRSACVYKIWLT